MDIRYYIKELGYNNRIPDLIMSLYKESIVDAAILLRDNVNVPARVFIRAALNALPPYLNCTETEYKYSIADHIGKLANMYIDYDSETDSYSLIDYRNYN